MEIAANARSTLDSARTFLGRHRSHLSAASMVAGFASDNVLLGRVDLPTTQALLAGYLAVAACGIALLHAAEARPDAGLLARWRNLFPMAVQFALGSLWSGLLVFYSRGAVFSAAWPFLTLLAAIFIGNEIFHRYVSRLVFSTTLLFFALFSFCVMVVPVYAHALGTWVFLFSGALALGLFLLFVRALMRLGPERYRAVRWKVLAGAAAVFATINLSYFTGILPPLPLALADSGIYLNVKKSGLVYMAQGEAQPWYVRLGLPATLHLAQGAPAYAFSSVFAPIKLNTKIRHVWQWYSPRTQDWITKSVVSFTVNGGRRGGYRGYTIKHDPADGDWRVDIETGEGRLIGRLRFRIAHDGVPTTAQTVALR